MDLIKLVSVSEANAFNLLSATLFLYQLLSERDPIANISHREMPTFDQHRTFVESSPYKAWYIIFCKDVPIGSVYLTERNEIGIAIIKDAQDLGYGKQAVRMLMEKHPCDRYLANSAPGNARSIVMFKELGFNTIQLTLAKDGPR